MSIATEITRLQGAKNDLKTSINSKTDAQHQITNETIDDYAEFVDSINSGTDISEYFENTISSDGSNIGWQIAFKKFPPLNLVGTSCMIMFESLPIQEVDLSNFNTENVTNMTGMFRNSSIKTLDLSNFDTSSLKTTYEMFKGSKIETLNISSFNFEKMQGSSTGSTFTSMFDKCTNLKNLIFGYNAGKGFRTTTSAHRVYCKIDLSISTLLTHDSLMSVINGLYDISDNNTQDLILGNTNLAKLTSEEIAIATNKGWTVS